MQAHRRPASAGGELGGVGPGAGETRGLGQQRIRIYMKHMMITPPLIPLPLPLLLPPLPLLPVKARLTPPTLTSVLPSSTRGEAPRPAASVTMSCTK